MISLKKLYERDGGICKIGNHPIPFEEASRDHIRPKSRGGSNASWNIQLSCAEHNNQRGNRWEPKRLPRVDPDDLSGYRSCAGIELNGRKERSVL